MHDNVSANMMGPSMSSALNEEDGDGGSAALTHELYATGSFPSSDNQH